MTWQRFCPIKEPAFFPWRSDERTFGMTPLRQKAEPGTSMKSRAPQKPGFGILLVCLVLSISLHAAILLLYPGSDPPPREIPVALQVGLIHRKNSPVTRFAAGRGKENPRQQTSRPISRTAVGKGGSPTLSRSPSAASEKAHRANRQPASRRPTEPVSRTISSRVATAKTPSALPKPRQKPVTRATSASPAKRLSGTATKSPHAAGLAQRTKKGRDSTPPPAAPAIAPSPPPSVTGGPTASSYVDAAPIYAENPPPRYPRVALLQGWSGEVWIRVRVSSSGRVLDATIEHSSGHRVLDSAALKAVRRWRFHPARRGDTPMAGDVRLPIRFKLRSS